MRIFQLLFLLFYLNIFCQKSLPILNFNEDNFKHFQDYQEDVEKLLKLKKDEICISFFTTGGLVYSLDIDNFIFKENGKIIHYKEKVFYKKGKKHSRKRITLTLKKINELNAIVRSDFFINFSHYTQSDFKYSENTRQICNKSYIDDAPENYVMITQNGKQTTLSVYLPKRNENCTETGSPLRKFIELHQKFDVPLNW